MSKWFALHIVTRGGLPPLCVNTLTKGFKSKEDAVSQVMSAIEAGPNEAPMIQQYIETGKAFWKCEYVYKRSYFQVVENLTADDLLNINYANSRSIEELRTMVKLRSSRCFYSTAYLTVKMFKHDIYKLLWQIKQQYHRHCILP
jgi:hypothetical protein